MFFILILFLCVDLYGLENTDFCAHATTFVSTFNLSYRARPGQYAPPDTPDTPSLSLEKIFSDIEDFFLDANDASASNSSLNDHQFHDDQDKSFSKNSFSSSQLVSIVPYDRGNAFNRGGSILFDGSQLAEIGLISKKTIPVRMKKTPEETAKQKSKLTQETKERSVKILRMEEMQPKTY